MKSLSRKQVRRFAIVLVVVVLTGVAWKRSCRTTDERVLRFPNNRAVMVGAGNGALVLRISARLGKDWEVESDSSNRKGSCWPPPIQLGRALLWREISIAFWLIILIELIAGWFLMRKKPKRKKLSRKRSTRKRPGRKRAKSKSAK